MRCDHGADELFGAGSLQIAGAGAGGRKTRSVAFRQSLCRTRGQSNARFHLHFTPTSSSWLKLVERWFRELTDKALRRRVFHSVPDLVASIQEYIDTHNNDPRPYVWTATAESILAKVTRGGIAPFSDPIRRIIDSTQ